MISTDKVKPILIKLLIVAAFLDAYSIVYIQSYPVTMFTLAMAALFLYGVYDIVKQMKLCLTPSKILIGILVVYCCFNCLLSQEKNIRSFMLAAFFGLTFFVTDRTETESSAQSYVKLFSTIMNILAVYGIYQFLARQFGLPFSDLVIPGHMVRGFNWSNQISIGSMEFFRSNAIFREPSFFSQYLAINLVLLLKSYLEADSNLKRTVFWGAVNLLAMVLSFAGTGIILLLVAAVIYILRVKKDATARKRFWILVGVGAAGIAVILVTPLGKYFLTRLNEVFVYNENTASGFVRFRSGLDVLKSAWSENLLFGTGIGTVQEYIYSLPNYYEGMTVNGFYRPAVELGLIGILLWIGFLLSVVLKKKDNGSYLALQCVILPFLICHETFMSNYFWLILYMLNYSKTSDSCQILD